MTEFIAFFIRFIIDVVCIGFCFRTKTFWGSVSAYLLICKAIEDYNKTFDCLEQLLKEKRKKETKIIEFKKEKTKMGFDMSGKA